MDKKIVILLSLLVLLPLISSVQIYPKDSNVDLKVPCFNNNTYCSSNSNCTITIISFDGDSVIENKNMTQNIPYHNYTLNTTQTSDSGEYIVSVACNDNGELGHSTFNYIITPTGKSLSTSSAITQGLILVLMFGVTIFFLLFGATSETIEVKLFFNLVSYVTMFLTVATGYILLRSSEVQNSLSVTINVLLYIVGIVLLVIMFVVMINQTRKALRLMQIKKGFGSEYDDNPKML